MARRTEQINIRLYSADFEVLEAAAYVHRLTPAGLLTEMAEEAIGELGREAATQTALKARGEADRAVGGTVSPIAAGRTVRRSKSREQD
jgi:hypothetical protein